MRDNPSYCKSCNAPILWVLTHKGKRTPLDFKPERVATLIELDGGELKIEDVITGHTSHWGTCPSAEQHRRALSDDK